MTFCHRCDEKPAAFEFTVQAHDGSALWACSLCPTCASFVCASADGRPVFARGSRAKFELGPRPNEAAPEDWGEN